MESFPKSTNTQQSSMLQFNPQQQQPQQQQQQQVNNISPTSFQPSSILPAITSQREVEEFVSPPKTILRPEIAGGLKVSILFRHGLRSMALLGSNSLFIEVTNCSKEYVIRYYYFHHI